MGLSFWMIGIFNELQTIAALLRLFPHKENYEDIK